MSVTPQPPANTRGMSGPLFPMLSAVLAVVGSWCLPSSCPAS
jgi:hypothetical protein